MAVAKYTSSVFQKKVLILLSFILLLLILLIVFTGNCLSSKNTNNNFNSTIISSTESKNIPQFKYEIDQIENVSESEVAILKKNFPLKTFIPKGWNSPLVINGEKGVRDVEFDLKSDQIFISWAITNFTEENINRIFYVDLLLDGVPVERWQFSGISSGESYLVTDWSDLTNKAYLSKGVHELSLDIDSTYLLRESISFNNNYSIDFMWEKDTDINAFENEINASRTRFPNLEFFVPDEWVSPLEIRLEKEFPPDVSSDRIDSSGISLQFAYLNGGLTTIDGYYQVHIYLNGIFASKFSKWGALPGEHVISTPLYTLLSDIELDYGEHTLKVILDPTSMVRESNENDNEYILKFIWTKDGINTKHQTLSNPKMAPKGLTDIHGYKFKDWSDPLVLSNEIGRYVNSRIVHGGSPLFVSWVLENYGFSEQKFEVELFLDDDLLEKWKRPNLPVGSLDMILDFPLTGFIDQGFHNVLLRVNTSSGESIDIFERQFYWDKSHYYKFSSNKNVTFLTNFADYWSMHDGLKFPEDQVVIKELTLWMSILYEEIHDQSIGDDLLIHVVDSSQYNRWIESECRDKSRNLSSIMSSVYLDNCQLGQHSDGYHTNWQGFNRIIIKWDLRPIEFVTVMSHELGHYYQSKQRSELDGSYETHIIALKECQAYVHQSLLIKALEEKLGFELMAYPATRAYEQFIKNEIMMLTTKSEEPHALGKLLAWDLLLNDSDLRLQRTNLFNNLKLDVSNEKSFFDYLIQLNVQDSAVKEKLFIYDLATLSNTVESFAVARLKNGLENSEQGDPFLRETGLLIP